MTETATETETETETAIETGEFSSLFSVYSPNVTCENLEIHRHWHRVNFVIRNSDYSMESAHERFLFTSCEASKIPTSERSKRVSFLMHRNWGVKSFKHFPWYDVFISYKLRFFQISIQRLAANACENTSFVQSETRTIVLDSTSKCKSQYL